MADPRWRAADLISWFDSRGAISSCPTHFHGGHGLGARPGQGGAGESQGDSGPKPSGCRVGEATLGSRPTNIPNRKAVAALSCPPVTAGADACNQIHIANIQQDGLAEAHTRDCHQSEKSGERQPAIPVNWRQLCSLSFGERTLSRCTDSTG